MTGEGRLAVTAQGQAEFALRGYEEDFEYDRHDFSLTVARRF